MPLTRSAIAQRLIALDVPFAGDTIHLKYRGVAAATLIPAQVIADIEAAATALGEDATFEQKSQAQTDYMAALAARLIDSWDVVESVNSDGSLGPVAELTPESLARFDVGMLSTIIMCIVGDATTGK